jgi:hypothetical protein
MIRSLLLCLLSFPCFAQPKIECQTIIDIGEVWEGPEYELVWYFKNAGNKPLEIERVQSSGSILTGSNTEKAIRPGYESKITGRLNTVGWGDMPFNKTLLLHFAGGKNILLTAKGYIRKLPAEGVPGDFKKTFSNAAGTGIIDIGANQVIVPPIETTVYYNIQPGDILFQDLDCGGACDAIEAVTEGANGMDFSHCGMVVRIGNEMKIVEAYGEVKVTDVNTFFSRSKNANGEPKVLIGRVKQEYGEIPDESANIAKAYIGKGYDDAFDMKNDKYYCSELLYECFKKANKGKDFFPLNKMTFNEPGTNKPMPFWVDYFKKLGVPVPEGKKGINPGIMSRSDKLELIKPERL